MIRFLRLAGLLLTLCACGGKAEKTPIVVEEVPLGSAPTLNVPVLLSEWGLFDQLPEMQPTANVYAYEVNSPLFSDYAYKARFVSLPVGRELIFDAADVFQFPDEAVIVKSFFYPDDFQKPEGRRRILETRLLVNDAGSWKPYTYVWNEEQTDATLEIAGRSIPVSWRDRHGALQKIDYSVPNLNQCKSCHERNGKVMPIGVTARQLNKGVAQENQLLAWQRAGVLSGLPAEGELSQLVSWENSEAPLQDRARSWLETNCAHCHRRDGPAKNSGLYLLASEDDNYALGINKSPVAAGRGSGGLKYAIFPGDPDRSILVHRIESLDPGVMMPELGRKMIHAEGVELVRQWIAAM